MDLDNENSTYNLHESPNMRYNKEGYGDTMYPEIKVERPLEEIGSQNSIEIN